MPYRHILEGCFSEGGALKKAFEAVLPQTNGAAAKLAEAKHQNTLPLLSLPSRSDDKKEILEVATYIRKNFKRLVVLGTGGSSLGGRTLVSLHGPDFGNAPEFPVHFLENVDPFTLERMLSQVTLAETAFLVISKSGSTTETLAQMLLCVEVLKKSLGDNAVAKQVIAITEPGNNVLRTLAADWGIRTYDHDPKVGGRFSVFSLVGLIPAATAGVDVEAVREGAEEVWQSLMQGGERSAPAQGAALAFAMMEQGYTDFVLMPYCDRMNDFGLWYRQLWAESLGKDGKGSTPVTALGTVDQHSQLQLYLDGPRNKFFSLVLLENRAQGRQFSDALLTDERLSYLRGRTLGDVMDAEQEATLEALRRKHCPARVFRLDALDAHATGALMMHFMLETMLTAHLMGVDAFDQPAVEYGKVRTRELLLLQGAEKAA